ncbi:MAG: N-6 DNA methylase [Pseudomonadota bacterium]
MNERKTEALARELLKHAGYYDKNLYIVEEQKSEYPAIDKLLKVASKKGKGRGFPEFIIRSKKFSDFIVVIECKASVKYHESSQLNQYADYAVDGALLYASFLSKEFDVLAIGISGQKADLMRISHFLFLKGASKPHKYFSDKILSYTDYRNSYLTSDIKFNQDYGKLLDYTKDLNEVLHSKKVKEAQRSLLISGILIALENKAFKAGYASHQKAEHISNSLISTIADEFSNANLPEDKVRNLKQAFSFIRTHTTLTSNKDFFVELITDIDNNINGFMRTYKYFDTIGQFYIEFLRYANNDKGLGIVLTPPHVTELFSEIACANRDSIVFDNCCGTGGFLISAMKRMIADAKSDSTTIDRIKNKQLIGIEYQDDIYALAVSNMVVHGDGKTNVRLGDCFELSSDVKREFKPSIGLLNPPYKTKKSDIEELSFVLNNLDTLRKGGICVAIVPLSCAISTGGDVLELKKQILREHTLEAVMSMPEDIFHNSKVNVVTCVLVITAHIPHPKGKKTWLGYWRDDGFVKTKGKGRIDLNNQWEGRKKEWLTAYVNREVKQGLSVAEELTEQQEWCTEAFMVTDYSQIDKSLFVEHVKRYLSYRLLNDLLDFTVGVPQKPVKFSKRLVPLTDLFDVFNGLASSQVTVKEEPEGLNDLRYIRPSQTYPGSIAGYVDEMLIDDKYIYPDNTIYVSTDGQGSHTYSYVSSFTFVPNSNVSVLIPKQSISIQEKLFYALCVTANRYKFSYGRKPKGNRLKEILVPECPPAYVFENVFDSIFEDWKRLVR